MNRPLVSLAVASGVALAATALPRLPVPPAGGGLDPGGPLGFVRGAAVAFADEQKCQFCGETLPAGTHPLKCPKCDELALEAVKRSSVRVLKFKHEHPVRVSVGDELHGPAEVYWYFTYTLTNEDTEPLPFFIDITAVSDKDRKYHDHFQPIVAEKAKKALRLKKEEVLYTQDRLSYSGEDEDPNAPFPRKLKLPVIPAGETWQCAAVFKQLDPEADALEIRVRGLTNDVRIEKTGKPHERKVTETVLALRYARRGGDEYFPTEDLYRYLGREWVEEERLVKSDLE